MSNAFNDRLRTQTFTPEFLQTYAQIETDAETQQALEWAAKRLERNYNCVAGVGQNNASPTRGQMWEIKVILGRDSDPKEIKRGMQSLQHWVGEEWKATDE